MNKSGTSTCVFKSSIDSLCVYKFCLHTNLDKRKTEKKKAKTKRFSLFIQMKCLQTLQIEIE